MKRLTWKKNHAPLFLHPLPRRDVLCSWVSPRGGGRRPKVFMSFVGENEPRLGASHGDLGERACFRFPGIGIDFDLRRSRRWRSADHVSGVCVCCLAFSSRVETIAAFPVRKLLLSPSVPPAWCPGAAGRPAPLQRRLPGTPAETGERRPVHRRRQVSRPRTPEAALPRRGAA